MDHGYSDIFCLCYKNLHKRIIPPHSLWCNFSYFMFVLVSTFKDKLSPKSKKKIVLNTVMELIETSSESEGEDDTVIINSLRARSDIFTISFLYRNERLRRNSIKNYFNEIIPTYTPATFPATFPNYQKSL